MAKTYIDGSSVKAINSQFWEFFNVNLTMSKRREVWQYGDTHYFILNDYKPQDTNTNTWEDSISVSDIPF